MLFQILAAVILAGFYGCYFLKMLRQRRRGIRTDQLGRGKRGSARRIEITLKIVTWLVPLAEAAAVIWDVHHGPRWLRLAGAVIGFFGVAVFVVSVMEMKDSWRAGVSEDEKTDLITTGIYRYSRNPAFLGFDLVYLGIGLMFLNGPLAALSVLAGLLLHLQITRVEEPCLASAFGEAYAAYKRQTCRYFGRRGQ